MPVQPIPERNNKDYSLSTNYCGIALALCFSKIIELQGEHLLSSSYNSARIINHYVHWCVKAVLSQVRMHQKLLTQLATILA